TFIRYYLTHARLAHFTTSLLPDKNGAHNKHISILPCYINSIKLKYSWFSEKDVSITKEGNKNLFPGLMTSRRKQASRNMYKNAEKRENPAKRCMQ
ncbi:hypothetical protein NXZ86_22500, partial [Escherichia coli]|nr:hypothetical protein [Escherichia coli]